MDFTKLLSLLKTNSLFFCRADNFEDKLEGSLPIEEYKKRKKILSEYDEKVGKHLKKDRELVFVNCWHYNTTESLAMWKQYLSSKEGVAVVTTIDKFKSSFDVYDKDVYTGKVKYIDYDNGVFDDPHGRWNIFFNYFHKRDFYSHENEYRAMIDASLFLNKNEQEEFKKSHPYGMSVPVNIDALIEKVIVSPESGSWFLDLVTEIVRELFPEIIIEPSKITPIPYF